MIGLTLAQRQAVTKANATRYKRAGKARKGLILDELCATTGWHRNHARKAQALTPRLVRPRAPRRPIYGAEIIAALAFRWAVLGAPTGKRLAPIMAELVPRLRRFQELVITDDAELALLAMSPATMDRRLAPDRAKLLVRGRSHTKPGSLLQDSIPIRTWAEWNELPLPPSTGPRPLVRTDRQGLGYLSNHLKSTAGEDQQPEEPTTHRLWTNAVVRSGDLKGIQIGGRNQWRVERVKLEEFIEEAYRRTAQQLDQLPEDPPAESIAVWANRLSWTAVQAATSAP